MVYGASGGGLAGGGGGGGGGGRVGSVASKWNQMANNSNQNKTPKPANSFQGRQALAQGSKTNHTGGQFKGVKKGGGGVSARINQWSDRNSSQQAGNTQQFGNSQNQGQNHQSSEESEDSDDSDDTSFTSSSEEHNINPNGNQNGNQNGNHNFNNSSNQHSNQNFSQNVSKFGGKFGGSKFGGNSKNKFGGNSGGNPGQKYGGKSQNFGSNQNHGNSRQHEAGQASPISQAEQDVNPNQGQGARINVKNMVKSANQSQERTDKAWMSPGKFNQGNTVSKREITEQASGIRPNYKGGLVKNMVANKNNSGPSWANNDGGGDNAGNNGGNNVGNNGGNSRKVSRDRRESRENDPLACNMKSTIKKWKQADESSAPIAGIPEKLLELMIFNTNFIIFIISGIKYFREFLLSR